MKFKKDFGGRDKYFSCQYKKDLAGDCVVRAIAIATGTDYKIVWDSLFSLGHELGQLPNSYRIAEKYLNTLGWIKHKPMRKTNGKRYRLKNVPINPVGSYIFQTSGHMTAVVDGIQRDTWNCQDWVANSYYINQHGVNHERNKNT